MVYNVRLEQFEGPLHLLLSLIEKEKLDITKVSLAKVADQYLEYLRTKKSISLDNLASFLAIAARLILIKSRALLPILEFSDEEEESMDDLEWRLKEYKRFREAAAKLGAQFEKKHKAFGRKSFLGMQAIFYPPSELTALELRAHFADVLGEIPVFEKLEEREMRAIIKLEDKILYLQKMLVKKVESSFFELTGAAADRAEVIVSFLALLEMVKQRFIFVEQTDFFSDIRIKRI
jgi:segregation and condensation protein A